MKHQNVGIVRIELKEKEINDYKRAADINNEKVTQYEIEKYYPLL